MYAWLTELIGFRLCARDGDLGHIREFYFDDTTWDIRYAVVDVGHWLSRQCVLIASSAFQREGDRCIHVDLSRKQVEHSPPTAFDKPVSRQHQVHLHEYYGWPNYWDALEPGPYSLAPSPPPGGVRERDMPVVQDQVSVETVEDTVDDEHSDPHLRSTAEVGAYHAYAGDDDAGRVDGFLVDTDAWRISDVIVRRGVVASTGLGRIETDRVARVDWERSRIDLDATIDEVFSPTPA